MQTSKTNHKSGRKMAVPRPNQKLDRAIRQLDKEADGIQKIQELEGAAFKLGLEKGRGELFAALAKIEARLEFLNERDNLNSFALAAPAPEFTASQSQTLRSRVAELESRLDTLHESHGALYSRVGTVEDEIGMSSTLALGVPAARRL